MTSLTLLSIQSHVAYGHVGNAAAVFPLQRIGVEVWPIHTVQFSNHAGYDSWKGRLFEGATIREIVGGIADRGVLGHCDGVLSGYLGRLDIGEAIVAAVGSVKAANKAASYCCDPVMGDRGRGIYVSEGIPRFIKEQALPIADVITPNQFEAERLAGMKIGTLSQAFAAIDKLHELGPGTVLVTSLETKETPDSALDLLVSDPAGKYRLRTPKLPISVNGAGDAIAALFFAHWMRLGSSAEALRLAGSALFGVLKRTAEAKSRELLLIEAQEEFVVPSQLFEPEHVGS